MIINHNMASLNTYNKLNSNTTNTAKSLEKLSSGLRINKAGDDAAGLAISEKMRGQIRGLDQSIRNAQDGISLIQTAEGSLSETQSILQRMKELATQAANDTNVTGDRTEIQKEMNQLSSEINRIGNTTEFNTQKLLKGTTAAVVEAAMAKTTITDGIAGVAAGAVSALAVDASSVKKVDSQATVQASRAEATGTASSMRTVSNSIKGAVSAVTLANGVVFSSKDNSPALNGRNIVIEQSATSGSNSSVAYASGTYTFTIGKTDGGVSKASNRGELYNELTSAMQNATGATATEVAKLSLKAPTDTSTAVTNVVASGTMANGRTETNGIYEFDITDKFEEAGDSITIDGQTLKTVLNGAVAANGEFAVGAKTQVTGGLAVKDTGVDFSVAPVTGSVTINVAGRDFKISTAALNTITDASGDLTDRLAKISNAAEDGTGILLSSVATVSEGTGGDAGKIKIVANDAQSAAITWTANGDIENRQLINEAFGMNTIAKLTGAKGVEPAADLDGVRASWDSGDINVSTIAAGEQASYTFAGVTVVVHATDAAGLVAATGTLGNAAGMNFTDATLKSSDAFGKIEVLSNSTVHMYWDVAAAANATDDSASFADNLATAFNAAKYYDGVDFNGPATGGLENFTIGNENGTVTADGNMGRLVFTDAEASGATNNANAIVAVAAANKGVIAAIGTDAQQRAAWDSGDLTAVATGDTKTFTFGGVTVNITGVVNAAALVGTQVGVADTKYDVSGNTINLTVDNSAVADNSTFSSKLAAVLNAAKGTVGSAEFNNFTFTGGNGTSLDATTGHLTITRDSGEALQSTYEMGGTLNITYNGAAAQRSTGTGREGMKGTNSISTDTTASFIVDGHEYAISNDDLKAAFNETTGANTAADVWQLISTRALDTDGIALSTQASVTLDANNKVVFTSLTEGSTSSVEFVVNGTGGTTSSDQVKRALGIDNVTASDSGQSALFETLTTASQADSLILAINADDTLGARFTATVTGSGSTITLTEKTNQAAGTSVASAVVAGAGSDDKLLITNTGGENFKTVTIQQSVQSAAVAAKTNKIDTSFQLTAASTGTELNGLKIAFSDLTSAATTAITATFDADTFTVNVTGTLAIANANQAAIATAMQTAINNELTSNGFANTLTATAGATDGNDDAVVPGGDLDIIAKFNDKVVEFGKALDVDAVMGKILIASNDTMAVSQTNGNLTINLANESAFKNTANSIQQLVQTLGTAGYTADMDFSKYQFGTAGNWDTETLGNSIKKDTSALVGGTVEVKGSFSFDVTTALAAGDIVSIAGKDFRAVAKNPVVANNEFLVDDGDTLADQAVKLADAVGAAFPADYTVTTLGAKVVLTENTADGEDMSSSDLAVRATGTKGEFSVAAGSLLTNGAKVVIDGQEIAVSNKNENVGYTNGTAIKQAASVADQTKAIADAINSNANLKNKYTASVAADGSLNLQQSELFASATAPAVSTKSSDKGNFTSTFQVGANSGQSMSIEVADMRASNLGITGDGSATTVKANNGSVASYVTTASVTDGTTDDNTEFALDVSTHDKATAAIGILDDALAAVSAQRSQLGAFQNRLEHTITNLGTSSENLTGAESRIRDVDMAKEMMQFQKNNILAQAATAMLAQANQQPQGVLQLLR